MKTKECPFFSYCLSELFSPPLLFSSPVLDLYFSVYLAFVIQKKIKIILSEMKVPKYIPIEDDNILVLWSGKKDDETNEKWEIVINNRLYQEKLYKTDSHPGITFIIGKCSRIEIDSSIGIELHKPLYRKRIIRLSDKIIQKLYRSGAIKKYPELLRLANFEGYGKKKKGKKSSEEEAKGKSKSKSKQKEEEDTTSDSIGLEDLED